MKISYQWLSELVDLSGQTPKSIADLITSRGIEVEEIQDLSQGWDKIVSAKIIKRDKHPQADRLSLCLVDNGKEQIDIVCGAQNMKAGDVVALAQIGAVIPNGLKIERSQIRGVTSNGMLCSEEELLLKDKSEGILILNPETPLGRPVANILGRNDAILTIKLTANRGDCQSHYGMAREIGSALGRPLKKLESVELPKGGSPIKVELGAGDEAPIFLGCMIEGVKVGSSPDWVVRRLEALGSRSINNVVDATNLLLFEMGHPTHAYDADILKSGKLGVRLSRAGEKIKVLDESELSLAGSELVITDGDALVGLAGVMGGLGSGVSEKTTRLFLECAEFNPVRVRRAALSFAKRTEAAQRFEKGIDPQSAWRSMARLAHLVTTLAGGKITGMDAAFTPGRSPTTDYRKYVMVPKNYFSSFLGMEISDAEAAEVLLANGCKVGDGTGSQMMRVEVPTYRLDLKLKEDLAEEVARHLGYDKIPSSLPGLSSQPTIRSSHSKFSDFALLMQAKEALASLGLSETLNYGFTSQAALRSLGFESKVQVKNPLSEELEWMVPSLLPALIQNAENNWAHHFGSESLALRLFEIRPVFSPKADESVQPLNQDSKPMETGVAESWRLAFLMTGPTLNQGMKTELRDTDFSDVRAVLERFLQKLGTKGVRILKPVKGCDPLFHPGECAQVFIGKDSAGFVGSVHPKWAKWGQLGVNRKWRTKLWVCELDWDLISKMSRNASEAPTFKAWGEFPPMERDFALLVTKETHADQIVQAAVKAGKPLARSARIFDVYEGSNLPAGRKSVGVRVIFAEDTRSIKEEETQTASAKILEAWKKEFGAELRG